MNEDAPLWGWRRMRVSVTEAEPLTMMMIDDAVDLLGGCVATETPRVYGHPATVFPIVFAYCHGQVSRHSGPGVREPGMEVAGRLWIGRHDMPRTHVVVVVPVGDPLDGLTG